MKKIGTSISCQRQFGKHGNLDFKTFKPDKRFFNSGDIEPHIADTYFGGYGRKAKKSLSHNNLKYFSSKFRIELTNIIFKTGNIVIGSIISTVTAQFICVHTSLEKKKTRRGRICAIIKIPFGPFSSINIVDIKSVGITMDRFRTSFRAA